MSKYLGMVVGAIIVVLGLQGLFGWWSDFLAVLKGLLPVIFILGGAIAVIAGISEIRDEISSKREEKK